MTIEDCPHCDDRGLVPGSAASLMSCSQCDAWDEMGTADPSVVAELVRLIDYRPYWLKDQLSVSLHIAHPDQEHRAWFPGEDVPEDAGVAATLDLLREVYDRFQRPGVAELLGRKP